MIGAGLDIILLLFALVGFGGTGASLAVARSRWLDEGDRDLGMWGVAGMLLVFGALCTLVATGVSGVCAFGSVVIWGSYVLMAQHLGVFRVEARASGRAPRPEEEPRSIT